MNKELIIITLKKIAKTNKSYFSNETLKKIHDSRMDKCNYCPIPKCKNELCLPFCSNVRIVNEDIEHCRGYDDRKCYNFLVWFKEKYLRRRGIKI